MESIIIHPNNKKQIRAFANMAKALNIDFQIKNENSENEITEEEFLKKFNDGITIEESRENTLRYVRSLWSK
ncbi:hypothetical protein EGI22_07565 [Lacihabitans sp. LS3-19]|uniref:DUF2683 family protein n=1 Tax=Lacihabitans sp. LS3-19 TaxID=2487335 RepID=UPI0020CC0EE8|nr:DUF2683 family protein [Lacihabitans sp. LS3-19]MCP9767767.1 hypothetical protein [Lacihabitans sp. LS3-19]